MADERDLTDTGQWTREIHGERRQGERRMDPHSLNRRLTEVERTQIEMGGNVKRIHEDFHYLREKMAQLVDQQATQGRQLMRAQNFAAGVIAVLAIIVTAWTMFGSWIARQIAESM